jgi:hypothetical protein
LLILYQAGSKCGSTEPPAAFTGNQFIGNVFSSPNLGVGQSPEMARMFVSLPVAAGNLLQNNDFGTADGPYLSPLSGFMDGGGNICGPLNPALSNFVCGGALVPTVSSVHKRPASD